MNYVSIIIIGSGPAGVSAAVYASQAGQKVLMFTGEVPGGQLTTTEYVENYPGVFNISGMKLSNNLMEHAKQYAEIVYENVETIEKTDKGFKIITNLKNEFFAEKLIIATGSSPRKLDNKSVIDLENKGVSYCAICDGMFSKGKNVAVVGGGNSAFEAVLYLSKICKKVYLIHRNEKFKAFDNLQKKVQELEKTGKVEIICNATIIEAISVDDNLEEIILQNGKKIQIHGLFVNVGHIPQTLFLKNIVKLDKEGYIIVNRNQKTNEENICACGDCCVFEDGIPNLKQAVVAAAQGCVAALILSE